MTPVANQTAQQISSTVTISAATNYKVTNVSIAIGDINSEQSLALQSGVKKITIANRDNGKIQYTFVSGQSGTDFKTIPVKNHREISDINFTGKTLYFQTDKVSTIEIEEFY